MFSWFSKSAPAEIGAILDAGDGFVTAALVSSDPAKAEPELLWSHTESFAVSIKDSTGENLKQAIFRSFAALRDEGLKSLRQRQLPAKVRLLQATLHAPLAYTVSRTLTVQNEKPVRVTREVIRDLERKAEADAYRLQSAELVAKGLRLKPLSSSAVALTLNGYPATHAFKSLATELSLCQHISLATVDFTAWLHEAGDKYLPQVPIDADSFTSLIYRALAVLSPQSLDYSVVMIGSGATEFFTVRDGLPQAASYVPAGLAALGDSLAAATGLLPHEAGRLLKQSAVDQALSYSVDKKAATADILAKYEAELTSLLGRAGDNLALPKTIFVLTSCDHESVFTAMLDRVAKAVTGTKHAVYAITSDFFTCETLYDPALLCLAYTFHKQLYEDNYLELMTRRERAGT